VAHFKFENSLNDETGNHNGSLRDPLEIALFAPGKVGNALQIDSTGASVECANPTNFDMGRSFSICAWVNTTKGGEVLVVYKGPRANFASKSRQFEVYGRSEEHTSELQSRS